MHGTGDNTTIDGLDIFEDVLPLFQGAPVLPRVDAGDGFDNILQRWIDNSDGFAEGQRASRTYQPYVGNFSGHQSYRLQLEPALPLFHTSLGLNQQRLSVEQSSHVSEQHGYKPLQQDIHGLSTNRQPYRQTMPQIWSHQPVRDSRALAAAQLEQHDSTQPDLESTYKASTLPSNAHNFGNHARPLRPSPDVSSPPQTQTSSMAASIAAVANGASSNSHPSREPSPTRTETVSHVEQSRETPSMPVIVPSINEAKDAWPKRKRGPISEASKEKERARNRRAQKRFRQREKERQEEREGALSALEAELASIKNQKANLERQNIALEETARLREEQKEYDGLSPGFDGKFWMESMFEDPAELLPDLTLGSCAKKFSEEDVRSMSFSEHKRIYRSYVEALRQSLSSPETPERRDTIVKLVSELCSLNLAIALAQPQEFANFHTKRLDNEQPEDLPPPPDLLQQCLAALHLSEEQKKGLLNQRRLYLKKLSLLMKQRRGLHRLISSAFPQQASARQRDAYAKAFDAIDQLKRNLRLEQAMLIQSLCASHQQVLAPEQTGTHIVTAYPFYPDVPMLVEVLASQTPGELSATDLLDVQVLPPFSSQQEGKLAEPSMKS